MTCPFSHIAKGETLLITQTMQELIHSHTTQVVQAGIINIISN